MMDNQQPNSPFMERLLWIIQNLYITDKTGRLVPFRPTPEQMRLYALIRQQMEANLPVRIIVLKARQIGITTAWSAWMYAEAHFTPHSHCFTSAHSDSSSASIFRMMRRFEAHLPESERLPARYSNKREIEYLEPHGSIMEVQTAGAKELKRGSTLQWIHASEAAFWPDPEVAMTALLQCLPNEPRTGLLIESTANGVGNEFWRMWNEAVERERQDPGGLDGIRPLFFSWLEHPKYQQTPPVTYIWGGFSTAEEELLSLGATKEQLYWRRKIVKEQCGGSEERFQQEYPATPEQAFLATGRAAIPREVISYHRAMVRNPARARFVADLSAVGGVRVEYHESQGAVEAYPWRIWRTAEDWHDYAIGVDVAEGILLDPSSMSDESDLSVIAVLDRRELDYVAIYIGRDSPDVIGEQAVLAARHYNDAYIGPEVNSVGLLTLKTIRDLGYPRILRRPLKDGDSERDTYDSGDLLGWRTTVKNRDLLIDQWIQACEGRVHEMDIHADKSCTRLRHYSSELLREEERFIINRKGRREAQKGYHDDILFAAFIAWQVHLRSPRTWHTAAPYTHQNQTLNDLARYDAIDTAADIFMEESSWGHCTS